MTNSDSDYTRVLVDVEPTEGEARASNKRFALAELGSRVCLREALLEW